MAGIYRRLLGRIERRPDLVLRGRVSLPTWEKGWVAVRSLAAVGTMRVAVVGGGLAGIAAALECADAGAEVTLLEGRPRLGGATFSIRRDGHLDGQRPARLPALLHRVPALPRAHRRDAADRAAEPAVDTRRRAGRTHRLDRPRAPARAGAPAPVAGALRLPVARATGIAIARAVRPLSKLDLADPALDRRTFGAWLREHGQSPAAVDALWDLIVLPTVNLPASEASLALAAKVFQTGLLEAADAGDIGYAAVPLQQLHGDTGRPRSSAPASTSARGRGSTGSGPEPAASQSRTTGTEWTPTPSSSPSRTTTRPRCCPSGALPHAELGYLGASPIVNLHVVYDRPVTDLPFAAGLDTPVQWVFDRTRGTGLERGQYLAVSLSCAREYIGQKVDELRAQFVPALAQLFPDAGAATVELFFVTREQRATFRQGPGTAALRPGARTRIDGLYLAGAWTDTGWPATMEGAVRSGIAAAHEIVGVRRTPSVGIAA